MDSDPHSTLRSIAVGRRALEGELGLPARPRGLVIFAHGSGSSRHSPRNAFVAERLRSRGFATLLFDLLTESEAMHRANVFDIDLLASRVAEAIRWARHDADTRDLPVGLFGASTGAAAALVAAAEEPGEVAAVVSRGGRPDLAKEALLQVRAPVLLIVGGADEAVLALNRAAAQDLACETRIEIVPDATHLFEEPGALETVVGHAGDWFAAHLATEKGTGR